jgi:hypothetical protein
MHYKDVASYPSHAVLTLVGHQFLPALHAHSTKLGLILKEEQTDVTRVYPKVSGLSR